MTENLHPHSAADLAFAPVLIAIERNLARLREASDLEFTLVLDLNDDDHWYRTPLERARRLERAVTRTVDRHGLTVTPTSDLHGLRVSHGEFAVSVMFGAALADYVARGSKARNPAQLRPV